MKGKATITLTDAASGKIIRQTEEHNMVTNALRGVFQPPKTAMLGGLNYYQSLGGFLPMSKNLLGGILLLGENAEEDPEKFMLKPEHRVVGYAGDPYSGTDVMRGTLNQNETYETENGYHFTWDFPTDKANGVIRCVSLTNRLFGNVGTGLASTDGGVMVDPGSPTTTSTCSVSLTSQNGQLLGMFESNVLTYAKVVGNNKLLLRKVLLIDPLNVRINDRLGGTVISETELEIPFMPSDSNLFVNYTERKVYYFSIIIDVTANTVTVRYITIDPVTGEVSDESRIVTEGVSAPSVCALYNGRLYFAVDSKLYVHSVQGTEATLLEMLPISVGRFYTFNGYLYVLCSQGGARVLKVMDDDYGCVMRTGANLPIPSEFINLPYTLHSSATYPQIAAQIMLYTNYLATINNLSQPIEKTSAQTLKISYDITN